MTKGEWVRCYTHRGSPRSGINAYRWRTNREKWEELVFGVLFLLAALIIGGVFIWIAK